VGCAVLSLFERGRHPGPRWILHSGLHGGVFRNPITSAGRLSPRCTRPTDTSTCPVFTTTCSTSNRGNAPSWPSSGRVRNNTGEFLGIPAFHPAKGYTPLRGDALPAHARIQRHRRRLPGREGTKTVIRARRSSKSAAGSLPNKIRRKFAPSSTKRCAKRMPKDVTFELVDQHQGLPYVVVPPDRSNTPKDQSPVLARAFRAADHAIGEVLVARRCIYAKAAACRSSPTFSGCLARLRALGTFSCPRITFTRRTRVST